MAARDGVLSKTHVNDEEFDEEEVWGLAEERDESSSPKVKKKVIISKDSSGSSSAWYSPASARKIPRASSQISQKSEAVQGSSAPLNIPDWSKIYQKNVKRGPNIDGEEQQHEHDNNGGGDDEEDGDEDRIIPPHEWLARKLARNQISSFSVCEGVGRTLKGRDLSKVRNAILSKTGFIE